jgi:hypothetical protein
MNCDRKAGPALSRSSQLYGFLHVVGQCAFPASSFSDVSLLLRPHMHRANFSEATTIKYDYLRIQLYFGGCQCFCVQLANRFTILATGVYTQVPTFKSYKFLHPSQHPYFLFSEDQKVPGHYCFSRKLRCQCSLPDSRNLVHSSYKKAYKRRSCVSVHLFGA